MGKVDVSVIVPTMNEEESIGGVLAEIQEAFSNAPYSVEILVVDTLSQDRTVEIARKMDARVIREDRRGYGRAYMTGFRESRGRYIATLDADLTYPASVIPDLVRRLEEEGLDFISCERISLLSREAMPPAHRVGNAILNLAVRVLYGFPLKDSQSGMWVFRREVLDRLDLRSWGMPFSEEIKLEALEKGLRFLEVPIRYRPRVGNAKIRSWADGWANLQYLISRRLTR